MIETNTSINPAIFEYLTIKKMVVLKRYANLNERLIKLGQKSCIESF